MKPCSCGVPGCGKLGPPGEHDWDPLAEPVDDCVICTMPLDAPIFGWCGNAVVAGPPRGPVRRGTGYAHGDCAV